MGCAIGQNSLFGGVNNYIKFNGGDLIAVEGPNTVERQMLSDLRFNYKQLLRGRVVLKAGQINYLLNHLGLGDNATFLSIAARYDVKSKVEEENYINWTFYDDLTKIHSMGKYMCLTGNSTNRVKQLYLTNPNPSYDVTLDVMVAVLDDSYNFFNDVVNQSGTSFVNLELSSINTYISGESIVVNDSSSKPLIYILLNNIETIELSGKIVIIDDSSLGKIFLQFKTEIDSNQANSLLNYVLENPNVDIGTLSPLSDLTSPTIYWLSTVGASSSTDFIAFNGATDSIPYDTSDGLTFSTSMSFTTYAIDSKISKSQLIDLLIDYVDDNRDGIITISTQSLLIGATTGNINQITTEGTYSLTFDLTDLAGNNLSGVNMTLNIQP